MKLLLAQHSFVTEVGFAGFASDPGVKVTMSPVWIVHSVTKSVYGEWLEIGATLAGDHPLGAVEVEPGNSLSPVASHDSLVGSS